MDELIERLAATPRSLAHLVAEADEARLDRAPAPGEWPARVLLAHFRDDEVLCLRVGLERMLGEEAPALTLLEGSAWEPARNRRRDRKEWLLGDFALQRQASVAILRSLDPREWERTGSMPGRGTFTVAQFVAAWVRHDADHIAQLELTLGETLTDVLARRARPN